MSNFKLWSLNPLSANPTKWSNTLKQLVGKSTQTIRRLLPANCLSVFDHFVGLVLKGLTAHIRNIYNSFIKFMNCIIVRNGRYLLQ